MTLRKLFKVTRICNWFLCSDKTESSLNKLIVSNFWKAFCCLNTIIRCIPSRSWCYDTHTQRNNRHSKNNRNSLLSLSLSFFLHWNLIPELMITRWLSLETRNEETPPNEQNLELKRATYTDAMKHIYELGSEVVVFWGYLWNCWV